MTKGTTKIKRSKKLSQTQILKVNKQKFGRMKDRSDRDEDPSLSKILLNCIILDKMKKRRYFSGR